jgi:hypothetical protein
MKTFSCSEWLVKGVLLSIGFMAGFVFFVGLCSMIMFFIQVKGLVM